jgi:hypothetical protein
MTPDDIRKIYAGAEPASAAERARFARQIATDPDLARGLLITLYSLAGAHAAFAELLAIIMKVAVMQLIAEKAHAEDDFALRIGALITEGLDQLVTQQPATRPQRGRNGSRTHAK